MSAAGPAPEGPGGPGGEGPGGSSGPGGRRAGRDPSSTPMADELPVRRHGAAAVAAVAAGPCTVVIGATGSGKTTQLPQLLLDAGLAGPRGVLGVTQPRRVAAVAVARRVAQERGGAVGGEVGYAVRFEERKSAGTRILYMTDGMLLREAQEDPLLRRYRVLVLDEAHERSLNTDLLFGLLKDVALNRTAARGPAGPLKLVVTSATLEGEKFAAYFGDCPLLSIPGRTFPVDIKHATEAPAPNRVVDAAVATVLDLHEASPPGDVLCFFTGQGEIERACRLLEEGVAAMPAGAPGALVLPLFASQAPEHQARVFAPAPAGDGYTRRIVCATNVAETSLTVPGVVYVVDPGFVKQKQFNPATNMDSLEVVRISRVQAVQRAGRAGRTQPGQCFRLYPKATFEEQMPAVTPPEILRTSLEAAVLHLKSLPVSSQLDVLNFDFLDRPPVEQVRARASERAPPFLCQPCRRHPR